MNNKVISIQLVRFATEHRRIGSSAERFMDFSQLCQFAPGRFAPGGKSSKSPSILMQGVLKQEVLQALCLSCRPTKIVKVLKAHREVAKIVR